MLKTLRHLAVTALCTGSLWACSVGTIEANLQFRDALTGEECVPDPITYIPSSGKPEKQEGLPRNPTGIPGDNMDDASSGITDCLYDGNSGHGDDKKHPCQVVGCDANGCCESDGDDPGDDDGDDPEDSGDGPKNPLPEDPSCDHLDDACGYGAIEPDTGECIYQETGACDGENDDPAGPQTEDPTDPSDPNDSGSDDPSNPDDPNSSGGDDPTSSGGDDPADPDCSGLNDTCGVGMWDANIGECVYQPSGMCSHDS